MLIYSFVDLSSIHPFYSLINFLINIYFRSVKERGRIATEMDMGTETVSYTILTRMMMMKQKEKMN